MNGTPRARRRSATRRSAVMSACVSLSIAHGPPMSTSGRAAADRGTGPIGDLAGDASRALARARAPAFTKPAKSGCGSHGRERNSGWNWPATKHGCSGSSMISTSCFSAQMPEMCRPFFSSCRQVLVVDLVAVAVALLDDPLARRAARPALPSVEEDRVEARGASCRPCRRACRCSGRRSMTGCGASASNSEELAPVEPAHVARELDHRALHAEADPEERHAAARARSAPPRSCPRCRGRRSRPARGCRGRRAKCAAAPSRSMCSASTQTTSTRASLAMPPCASASIRLL